MDAHPVFGVEVPFEGAQHPETPPAMNSPTKDFTGILFPAADLGR